MHPWPQRKPACAYSSTVRKNRPTAVVWVSVLVREERPDSSNLTIIVGHITDHGPILALRRPQVIQAAGWR